MIGAQTYKAMIEAGLTQEQILAILEAMNADAGIAEPDQRSPAAIRQARYRHNKRNEMRNEMRNGRNAQPTPPKEYISNPPSPSEPKGSSGDFFADEQKQSQKETKRATRLPDDFVVPDDWIEWAHDRHGWPRATAIAEGEIFCRHWQAKSGQDATKTDWKKTWQNWIASDLARRKTGGGARDGPDDFFANIDRKYGAK